MTEWEIMWWAIGMVAGAIFGWGVGYRKGVSAGRKAKWA